ncbi:seminase-like [Drosophila serrata]|uniref:seminase-like n=1 Tax=Drosophila serrata TaxID=7274 RepID=UPI000A1D2597|nr:seminase-like [Drosophila serrata]
MQRLLTCLLLAVIVQGTVAFGWNPVRVKDPNDPNFVRRVIGGIMTSNAELGGYIVAMRYYDMFACGGTLIQETIVLTAAHCFVNREKKDQWDFIGGISNLNEMAERHKMKDMIISPDFRPEDLYSDVAIVLLKKPLVGRNIGTVSLCTTELKPGMPVVVSGWGLTREGAKQENYLRTVTVPVIDWEQCRSSYNRTEVILSHTMICAGVRGSKDACLYDSGGPLVYNKEICGIVSFGIGCAHKNYPGVYTDVRVMKPFIEESIERLLSLKYLARK